MPFQLFVRWFCYFSSFLVWGAFFVSLFCHCVNVVVIVLLFWFQFLGFPSPPPLWYFYPKSRLAVSWFSGRLNCELLSSLFSLLVVVSLTLILQAACLCKVRVWEFFFHAGFYHLLLAVLTALQYVCKSQYLTSWWCFNFDFNHVLLLIKNSPKSRMRTTTGIRVREHD